MTSSGCDLSNIGLNNQLLVSKKLHERTRNNSLGRCFDMTASLDVRAVMNETQHNLALLPDLNVNFNDVDGRIVCNESKLSKGEPQQTRHLKDLLLLHLDWIQQQQESLLEKDRQIQRLKQEKDTLKCRLERMERRMALLRQRKEPLTSPKANEQNQPKSRTASPAASGGQCDVPGRGSKRKLSFESQNLNKKFDVVSEVRLPKIEMLNKSTSTDSDVPAPKKSKYCPIRPVRRRPYFKRSHMFARRPQRRKRCQPAVEPLASDDIDKKTALPQAEKSDTNGDTEVKEENTQKQQQSQSPTEDGLHRTSIMYCADVVTHPPPCDLNPLHEQQEEVKVPTFRIKHVPTGYQLEGTENLTDEAFLKRHQKPEADEKRRKRWDAQMLREQKMLERLQRREHLPAVVKNGCTGLSRKYQKIEEIHSFLPDPQNAKFIEVCDEIPINVFGYAIPYMKPTEFSLPWYDAENQLREEKSRSSSSRAHRK